MRRRRGKGVAVAAAIASAWGTSGALATPLPQATEETCPKGALLCGSSGGDGVQAAGAGRIYEPTAIPLNRNPSMQGDSQAQATGSDVVCRYRDSDYADGGAQTPTSLYAVDDDLGVHAFSDIAEINPLTVKSGFAWANVGVTVKIGDFPPGSSVTVKYPWHVRGRMQADADPEASGEVRYHFRLGFWNVTNGVKTTPLMVESILTADAGALPISRERTVTRDYDN